MGNRVCMRLFLGGAVVLLAGESVRAKDAEPVAQKEVAVATLSKEQAGEFAGYVRAKNLRREEYIVCNRMIAEKQGELKGFVAELAKEFGIASDKSYTFEKATKTLFVLSTNKVDKAGKPERTLVRQMKTESEAQYVSRLMVARGLTEQQIQVLAQIRDEKAKEVGLVDTKLRQTFKLDPEASYRLDDKTGQVFRLPTPQPEPVAEKAAQSGGREAAAGGAKESPKKK